QPITVLPLKGDMSQLFSASFAVSLVYVSYAYSGWNASAYLASEIANPRINVPKSLFIGTFIVMLAYVFLNFIFLYTVPTAELSNKVEIGYISANFIFGKAVGGFMGMMIALLLVSSISSMIFAGPRVTQVMGEDIPLLSRLAWQNKKGLPVAAIILQSIITLILIFTASFDSIIKYVGFTLSLFTFMTVLGVFVLRINRPNAERVYKAWGYPLTPIIFLSLTLWTLVFLMREQPVESLFGLGTVALGLVIYFVDVLLNKKS
ncbi:MAG: amino acid permease, partial [Bacteroidota bacterium]